MTPIHYLALAYLMAGLAIVLHSFRSRPPGG